MVQYLIVPDFMDHAGQSLSHIQVEMVDELLGFDDQRMVSDSVRQI